MTGPVIVPGRSSPPGRTIARRTAAATLAALVVLGACGTTVDNEAAGEATRESDIAGPSEDTARPPLPADARATDWLPELALELSELGSLIADGGEADETFARIEEIWIAIGPDIEVHRPDLFGGFGSTIDMARIAVERTRPADADKAFSILIELVDRYDDDG